MTPPAEGEISPLTIAEFEAMNAQSWQANAQLWFEGGSATPFRNAMLGEVERLITREREAAGGPLRLGDLGCGDGGFLRRLKESGFDGPLHGVDFSPQLIAHARRGLPVADFHTADLCDTAPLPVSGLRIATCLLTLIEIARFERTLQLIRDAMVPGGLLIISLLDPTVETLRFLEFKRGKPDVRLYDVEGDLAIAAAFQIQGQASPGPYYRFVRPIDRYANGLLQAGFSIEQSVGVRHSGFPFRTEPRGVIIAARATGTEVEAVG